MIRTRNKWGLMKPTLGSRVEVFSTAVVAVLVAGVLHQPVGASDKGAKPCTTWGDYEDSADSGVSGFQRQAQPQASGPRWRAGNRRSLTGRIRNPYSRYRSRRVSNVAVSSL
jgi:hypothetical protein